MRERRRVDEPVEPETSGTAEAAGATTRLPSLLVLGALSNLWLLRRTIGFRGVPPEAQLPALVFCAVNAFRCAFPNRYNGNIVWRDTPLSSIFLTRVLATLAELAWVAQLGWYVRELCRGEGSDGAAPVGPLVGGVVGGAAWLMVALCAAAQGFVWLALLLETERLMWFEEALWAAIFVLNTAASAALLETGAADAATGDRGRGVVISLAFALPYLVFQLVFHLPHIAWDGGGSGGGGGGGALSLVSLGQLRRGAERALFVRKQSNLASAWGGVVGTIWMWVYWVVLPLWPVYIAEQYQSNP